VSISSVLSPSALASQALMKSPAGAAVAVAGSFASTLLQALQRAGAAGAPAAAGGTSAAATASGTSGSAASGALHAHGGGAAAQALLQTLQSRAAPAPGQLLNAAA